LPVLLVASSNPGKIAEVQLGVCLWLRPGQADEPGESTDAWTVEPVPQFPRLPGCVEDGLTFAENARKKALHYSRFTDGLIVADDSGLEVDALRGAPGVKSRRFAGPAATDADNNAKLLVLLAAVPAAKRTARFVCELALAQGGKLLAQFRGVAEGLILRAPRGEGGFGYDPLFLDPESEKTFAELSPEEKLARSHRGRALRALLDWLAEQSLQEARGAHAGGDA
jgi:XTP/dITP diphosphohydrolase